MRKSMGSGQRAGGSESESSMTVLKELGVSRETAAYLHSYVDYLTRWNRTHNLVAASTLEDAWRRHVLDSAQLLALAPSDARLWVDMGSGAGLPGMILAILLRERPGAEVHLIESHARKCAFLHAVARETGAPVRIHHARIQQVFPSLPPVHVVTARALASLPVLLDLCEGLWTRGTIGLFPKGQDVDRELTEASKSWRIDYQRWQSRSDPQGCILRIDQAERLQAGPESR